MKIVCLLWIAMFFCASVYEHGDKVTKIMLFIRRGQRIFDAGKAQGKLKSQIERTYI